MAVDFLRQCSQYIECQHSSFYAVHSKFLTVSKSQKWQYTGAFCDSLLGSTFACSVGTQGLIPYWLNFLITMSIQGFFVVTHPDVL